MEKEELADGDRNHKTGEGKLSHKHGLADLWVIREDELGQHEDYIHCRSHIGKFLEVGDEVMGYDMKTMNANNEGLDQLDGNYPDAVMIRKVFASSKRRKEKRKWVLKRVVETKKAVSYQYFILFITINIFKMPPQFNSIFYIILEVFGIYF
jgi:nonsense-mediated mRNA decay protein 3